MMKEEGLLKEKLALVEELGVHFECNDNLPPLASRIIVYLILTGVEGATFEELVEKLEASKSSVSTNLQLLQSIDRITYFTRCGDRKRHFKISPSYIIARMDERISMWQKESKNNRKIFDYKVKALQVNNKYNENHPSIQFSAQVEEFINKMINNLEELKQNLLTIINKEENEESI